MIGRMNRNWKSFARTTQIIIGAFRVHAFKPVTFDHPLAAITGSMVRSTSTLGSSNDSTRLLDADKIMKRMLFASDPEAGGTSVEIRTVETFIAITVDHGITEVTVGIMNHQFGYSRRLRRCRNSGRWSSNNLPFAVSTEYGVHDDPSRFIYIKELMERIVGFRSPSRNTGCAQIVV
jgi:hypothetical protein